MPYLSDYSLNVAKSSLDRDHIWVDFFMMLLFLLSHLFQ